MENPPHYWNFSKLCINQEGSKMTRGNKTSRSVRNHHSVNQVTSCVIVYSTDFGRPMPFFMEIQNFWADKFWGIWGIFCQTIRTHFDTVSPLSMFPLFNHYFYKNLSLYIHIPNVYLGLGFEFGPQRIRYLAFVCPQSVIYSFDFH